MPIMWGIISIPENVIRNWQSTSILSTMGCWCVFQITRLRLCYNKKTKYIIVEYTYHIPSCSLCFCNLIWFFPSQLVGPNGIGVFKKICLICCKKLNAWFDSKRWKKNEWDELHAQSLKLTSKYTCYLFHVFI